ncbi:MAG TPA: hypothetical protein VF861_10305 [Telluria sp.]
MPSIQKVSQIRRSIEVVKAGNATAWKVRRGVDLHCQKGNLASHANMNEIHLLAFFVINLSVFATYTMIFVIDHAKKWAVSNFFAEQVYPALFFTGIVCISLLPHGIKTISNAHV